MLIYDPAERLGRARAKREAVLRFLADEIWTSSAVLQRVVGINARQPTHRLLMSMEQEGLIRRGIGPILAGQGVTLWGITAHGLALSTTADPTGRYFEPSKLSIERVPHQLALQKIRLAAEAAGWTDWTRGESLGKNPAIRPDATARRPDGHVVAVEYERTAKTSKRYQRILFEHLQAIRDGKWTGVYYVCPLPLMPGLTRLFTSITILPGGAIFDDTRRSRFKIIAEDVFPTPANVRSIHGDP